MVAPGVADEGAGGWCVGRVEDGVLAECCVGVVFGRCAGREGDEGCDIAEEVVDGKVGFSREFEGDGPNFGFGCQAEDAELADEARVVSGTDFIILVIEIALVNLRNPLVIHVGVAGFADAAMEAVVLEVGAGGGVFCGGETAKGVVGVAGVVGVFKGGIAVEIVGVVGEELVGLRECVGGIVFREAVVVRVVGVGG